MSYQKRVWHWMLACFGVDYATNPTQRNQRFLEEALELVQANGCTASVAHQLVDYVFGRPVGEAFQEVGGVRVTLSALCSVIGINEDDAAETELARINIPAVMEKVRRKQATKPNIGV